MSAQLSGAVAQVLGQLIMEKARVKILQERVNQLVKDQEKAKELICRLKEIIKEL